MGSRRGRCYSSPWDCPNCCRRSMRWTGLAMTDCSERSARRRFSRGHSSESRMSITSGRGITHSSIGGDGFTRLVRGVLVLLFLLTENETLAETATIVVGDCVIFREGGVGRILKTPTYWVRGRVVGVAQEQRMAGRCPRIDKPVSAYSHQDWTRVAAVMPCVGGDGEAQEVNVTRIRFAVEDWDTPWSSLHGAAGMLFRGSYLDRPLRKGGRSKSTRAGYPVAVPDGAFPMFGKLDKISAPRR